MTSSTKTSFKISLLLHGLVFCAIFAAPFFVKGCVSKKPKENVMMIEFTVSVPPAAIETQSIPEPTPIPPPPPPKPDIPIPKPKEKEEKKPEPQKEEPAKPQATKDIRQTNRVVRNINAPAPKDTPLSDKEIERLLKLGAKISDKTSIPQNVPLGAYYNHVQERMYAAWNQPAQLKNLPGLSVDVSITVAPDGSITGRTKTRGSGNEMMDESVMKAVQSVSKLRPLPAGQKTPVTITITFELS